MRTLLVAAALTVGPTAPFVQVGDQLIERGYFEAGDAPAAEVLERGFMGGRPRKVALWPDGVLPLHFNSDVGPDLRRTVLEACAEWASAANLRCIEGSYQGRRLVIGRSFAGVKQGCWSMLGRAAYFVGLRRRMNLGPGCESYSTVLHELGHALGLTHEHQRNDRDDFVRIIEENVHDPFLGLAYRLNFKKQSTDGYTPYDFESIMHYGRRSASKNGGDTIVPHPGYESMIDVMGGASHLSDLDRSAIAAMYGARPEAALGQLPPK
jgi:hypothetical protein